MVTAPGSIIVVVPTYNESENLAGFVGGLLGYRPDLQVLVVDDASPDGTGELADEIAKADARVSVLHRPRKLGLGTAYVDGFRWALARGFDLLVEMDADFSHRLEDLPRLLEAVREADVVIGSRNVPGGGVEGWPLLRRLVSRGGSAYARLVLGGGPRDYTGGYKVFRAAALRVLDLDHINSNGYAFQVEANHACWRAGLRIAEVPILFRNRAHGRSKMSWQIAAEAAMLVLRLRLGLVAVALAPEGVGVPAPR